MAVAGQKTVGTNGNDVIVGTSKSDRISAGAGRDVICAGAGNDRVSGGKGNLFSGATQDYRSSLGRPHPSMRSTLEVGCLRP